MSTRRWRSCAGCGGREHGLVTAACAVCGKAMAWQARTVPKLAMRRFGEACLAGYIAAEGEAVFGSAGAYRIEGRGVQLFEQIEGDCFAILGLPLFELLAGVRGCGMAGSRG